MTAAPPRGLGTDAWSASAVDLDAYVERLAYRGPLAPDLSTLHALHRAHATTIPFENLDVPLGRPIVTDLEAIQTKLLAGPRGGYCFEHNLLLGAVLERIGFPVRRLAGRARLGSSAIRPRTHMMLAVEVEGSTWLADVGFGCAGLLEPLPLRDGAYATQSGWLYVLARAREDWVLRTQLGSTWLDLYSFTLVEQLPIDYVVANHYIATHSTSPFVGNLVVQGTTGEVRHALHNRLLVEARPGTPVHRRLVGDAALAAVLREAFAIELSEEDARRVASTLPAPDEPRAAIPRGVVAVLLDAAPAQ